ncbi:MAG: 3-methyl-2-oxobutanoate hydroxymethyltransferase [Kineosporiaceae bacterium]
MSEAAGTPAPLSPRRVRVPHLARWKVEGRRWAMLTAYDINAAQVFDEAGIPVLLVGDSAANVVYGHPSSGRVTMDEMVPLVAAVARSATRALVVADLPFGSYEASTAQAVGSAVRMMRDAGAHAVKLEGGVRMAAAIRALTDAGIPVMGHVGFTPQSEHLIGGYRVAGRGEAAEHVIADAHAVAEAGAFAVVLEMVPAPVAATVTKELAIPTIGIGAGPDCDAQVLVWQDMAGLSAPGRTLTFVKRYADVRGVLGDAARRFAEEVAGGSFPDAAHSFDA